MAVVTDPCPLCAHSVSVDHTGKEGECRFGYKRYTVGDERPNEQCLCRGVSKETSGNSPTR